MTERIFEFKIDAEATDMFFFKSDEPIPLTDDIIDDDDKEMIRKGEFYLKKNYVYITTDNKLYFKNLGVKKKSTSKLTRLLWNKEIIPRIIKEKKVKFPKSFFKELIYKYLNEDITLATLRYNVKDAKEYDSKTCLYHNIAVRYGPGIINLIPNNITGVGKDKKYCTVEEFKEHGLTVDDINLDNVWRELGYFIKPVVERNIFSFEVKK